MFENFQFISTYISHQTRLQTFISNGHVMIQNYLSHTQVDLGISLRTYFDLFKRRGPKPYIIFKYLHREKLFPLHYL